MGDLLANARVHLSALEDALAEGFDPERFGFPWYESIEDRAVRAVRSNQAIGLVDAAEAHLEALIEAARQVRELVGPNGRVMPTPDETDELREINRIYVEITDALRAAGSVLDVLGGLVVLFLGLPVNPTFAQSTHLVRCGPEPRNPSSQQEAALATVRTAVADTITAGPPGWLEWTIESRNALVHRGTSLAMWAPVSTKSSKVMVVITRMTPQRVVRQFPHLRREPDLSDAESVLAGRQYDDVWLREPAHETLDGLGRECAVLTATVAQALGDLLGEMGEFNWPAESWALVPRSDRARAADEFGGFDPDHAPPVVTSLVLNPRDAKRLLAVEHLRREGADV